MMDGETKPPKVWTLWWQPEDPEQDIDEGFEVLEVDGPHSFDGRIKVIELELVLDEAHAIVVTSSAEREHRAMEFFRALLAAHGRLDAT